MLGGRGRAGGTFFEHAHAVFYYPSITLPLFGAGNISDPYYIDTARHVILNG
jgi:hypothetical protein